jgi:hypothetical protein
MQIDQATRNAVVLVAPTQLTEEFDAVLRDLARDHTVGVVFTHPVDPAVIARVKDAGAALTVASRPNRHVGRERVDEVLDALWRTRATA